MKRDKTMTQQDKDLLLKVLCDGLPYGVKVKEKYHTEDCILKGIDLFHKTIIMESKNCVFNGIYIFSGNGNVKIKPYLRDMEDMTEEEEYEYENIKWCNLGRFTDWLNKKHFNWRGLSKERYIKVTKENNPYKE